MRIHKVDQGSDAWKKLRLGKVTASEFHKVVPLKDGGWRAEGKQLMYRLIGERLTDAEVDPIKPTQEMIDGIEREPYAAEAFSRLTKWELKPGGFVETWERKHICQIGCSPDRIIPDQNAVLEIKCPKLTTHIGYIVNGPGEAYREQCQGQMLIGGWTQVHFFSWFPDSRATPVWKKRERDDVYIKKLERWLLDFCEELDRCTVAVLKYGPVVKRQEGELTLAEPDDGDPICRSVNDFLRHR
jgi:hypothetical protein